MIIRQETVNDYKTTESVIEEAFMDAEFADHTEHLLVQRLRACLKISHHHSNGSHEYPSLA